MYVKVGMNNVKGINEYTQTSLFAKTKPFTLKLYDKNGKAFKTGMINSLQEARDILTNHFYNKDKVETREDILTQLYNSKQLDC